MPHLCSGHDHRSSVTVYRTNSKKNATLTSLSYSNNFANLKMNILFHLAMCQKLANMANNADPDQTAPRSSLIRVYTVALGLLS